MGATATIQGERHGGIGVRLHILTNFCIKLRTQLPRQDSTGPEQHTISAIASSRGGERNGQPQHGVKLRLLLPHMLHSNSSCSLRSSITAAVAAMLSVESAAIEVAVAVPMSATVACGCHMPATTAAMYRLRCLLAAMAAASCRTFIINA